MSSGVYPVAEAIRNYDQQHRDKSCQIEQVEVHSDRRRIAGRLNLAFLHFTTTTAVTDSALHRLEQPQMPSRYQ